MGGDLGQEVVFRAELAEVVALHGLVEPGVADLDQAQPLQGGAGAGGDDELGQQLAGDAVLLATDLVLLLALVEQPLGDVPIVQPVHEPDQVVWLVPLLEQGVDEPPQADVALRRLDEPGLVGGVLPAVAEDQQLPLLDGQAVHQDARHVGERRGVPEADGGQDVGGPVPAGADRADGPPALLQQDRAELQVHARQGLLGAAAELEARGVEVAIEEPQLPLGSLGLVIAVGRLRRRGLVVGLLVRTRVVGLGVDLDALAGRIVEVTGFPSWTAATSRAGGVSPRRAGRPRRSPSRTSGRGPGGGSCSRTRRIRRSRRRAACRKRGSCSARTAPGRAGSGGPGGGP